MKRNKAGQNATHNEKTMRTTLLAIACLGLTTAMSAAFAEEPATEQERAQAAVIAFETYCYRTDAEYDRAIGIAEALDMQRISEKMLAGLLPPDPVEKGAGYVLARYPQSNSAILFSIVEGADACTVSVAGIDPALLEQKMQKDYHLQQKGQRDVGLQTNTFYVPGEGATALTAGVITLMKSKPGYGPSTMSLSYLPPRSVEERH